jgi:hypothetical protein
VAHADFVAQAEAFDTHILQTAFDKRVEWFGAEKARHMSSPEFLRMTYKPLLHSGKDKMGGGRYPDTIKIKMEHCASRVADFVTETRDVKGKPTTVVKEVLWKPTLVDSAPPPGSTDPKFFLCYGQDPKTGVDLYASKVPLLTSAGAILKDVNGKPIMRYVGPEDIKRGCRVHPIFSINKMYVVEGFGPMLTLGQLYIKPIASHQELRVESANVVDDIDPEITARLLGPAYNQGDATSAANDDDERDSSNGLPFAPIIVNLSHSQGRFDASELPSMTISSTTNESTVPFEDAKPLRKRKAEGGGAASSSESKQARKGRVEEDE